MQFEHKIVPWEKRDGRLKIAKGVSIPEYFRNNMFTLYIENTPYFARKFDTEDRVWLGRHALDEFQVGDVIVIELKDNIVLVKKKRSL